MTTTDERLETGHGPLAPRDDSVLRRFLLNQSELNRQIGRTLGGRHEDDGEASLSDAGSPVAFLNQAVLQRPVLEVSDPLLDRVDGFFAGSPAATVLSAWPTPDLTARGWVLMGHPMFVVAPPASYSSPAPAAAGVRVEPARTVAQMQTAEQIVVDGYPVPEATGRRGSMLPPGLVETDVQVRLGLLDDQPVSVGMAMVTGGVVNLAVDATLPLARRRGVWSAVVADRRRLAPELPAVAFTSDFSRSGFVRLGFLPVTRFTLWVRPGGAV